MHLLHLQDDGEFSLVKHSGKNIPHYAILSHTWGSDDDEVTFQDITERSGESKAGYRKIRFCGEQAKQDRLQHFWVDTCCINKSSSAELSEAINSMFRWYRDAAKCYVYLSDVSVSPTGNARDSLAFLESRWFTRGWTLQELLAPACVEFFSMEGDLLGDKHSRVQEISKVTNIAAEALQGNTLSRFSVKERMAWAKERETTREEDRAYSLLGIFDIHMPLLYGEGEEKALKRLNKEIRESSGDAAAKTNSSTREERLSKIHQWLSAPDPSVNYQKALKQRQHDTGLWFLEGEQYASWKTVAASFLWLYGIPGCGKTILSSTILQNLFQHCADNPGHAVAYFYFDFNDVQKQDAELMLRSLVGQLSQQAVDVPPSLDALFSSCEGGKRQPSLDSLLQVARRTVQQLPQVYVMLDALDECAQRSELMEMLETMAGWQLTNVHVIMTSRRERDIESSLGGLVDPQNSVCLQGEVVDKDILQYVRQRLSDDKGLNKWGRDATLRQQIESALMKGSKGMFRWAVCQLDTLGKCRNRTNLRKALATLPPTLDKTYERILCAIAEEDAEYAVRVLLWLAFSGRPLAVNEVAEVIAINVTRDPAFDREEVLEDPQDALDICSSLVTIATDNNNGNGKLQSERQIAVLAHYSVKEYLVSDRIQRGEAARYSMQAAACHSTIAKACLGYLGQFQKSEPMAEDTLGEYQLARYSAAFWLSHAQKAGDRGAEMSRAALHLLSRENAAYLNWIRIHDPDRPWQGSEFERVIEKTPNPLYYAALFGLEELVRLLLDKGADINAQGGYHGNALQAASVRGHEQVVKLLLDEGADIKAPDRIGRTTLLLAAENGNEAIVSLLVKERPDLLQMSEDSQPPFLEVVANELAAVVESIHTQDKDQLNANTLEHGYTPLLWAAAKGHERVVELLLQKGVDPDSKDRFGQSPLLWAAANGHEAVLQQLLAIDGVDLNSTDTHPQYGQTPLAWAAKKGHVAAVSMLLAQDGVDVNRVDSRGRTPQLLAEEERHDAVLRVLRSRS